MTVAMLAYATIEEMLKVVFSVPCVLRLYNGYHLPL
jgi:hypothetical protein